MLQRALKAPRRSGTTYVWSPTVHQEAGLPLPGTGSSPYHALRGNRALKGREMGPSRQQIWDHRVPDSKLSASCSRQVSSRPTSRPLKKQEAAQRPQCAVREQSGIWNPTDLAGIPALPPSCCVTLGKPHNPSEPHCPSGSMGTVTNVLSP